MLFRVIVELRPATVAIVAEVETAALLKRVVAMAAPKAEIVDGRADLLICDSLRVCPDADNAIFLNPANGAIDAFSARQYGHLYRNPDIAIYVGHNYLPRQTFEVKF